MRKFTLIAAALLVVGAAGAVQADVIAYWNFNQGTNLGGTSGCFQLNSIGTNTSSADYPSDSGVGVASLSAWDTHGGGATQGNLQGPNGSGGTPGNQICSFAGSTLNALNSDPAGGTLSPIGSAQNGHYFTLKLDNAISAATLSYATRGTGTGYNLHSYSYSTDGGANWTNLSSQASNQTSTFNVLSVNLGNIFASTSGSATNLLRISVSGGTGTNGNNRFDNVQINGTLVPEPATLSLLALGALTLIRRRK